MIVVKVIVRESEKYKSLLDEWEVKVVHSDLRTVTFFPDGAFRERVILFFFVE